jgi:hypothetical protein
MEELGERVAFIRATSKKENIYVSKSFVLIIVCTDFCSNLIIKEMTKRKYSKLLSPNIMLMVIFLFLFRIVNFIRSSYLSLGSKMR